MANVKGWVLDSRATRHICTNINAFISYTPLRNRKEVTNLRYSCITQVMEKGEVILKLTSWKTLSLLHVPNIKANLISMALLGKAGVKVSFESDQIMMIKKITLFVGNG